MEQRAVSQSRVKSYMRGDRVFLDTNIIIYAYDSSAGEKHKTANGILAEAWDSGNGVLSTQVLQEFFVSATKRIQKPLPVNIAKEIVNDLMSWNIVVNDGESVLKAIDLHQRYHHSFWDSMIIQAAIKSNAVFLLSEDLSDGQIIKGVTIRNPFS